MRNLEVRSASRSPKCCFSCMFVSLAMPGGSSQLCSSVRQMFSKHKHAISLKHFVLANCLDLLLWALCQVTRNPLFCLLNVHSQSQFLPHEHHVPAWHLSRSCKILWTVCQVSLILGSQDNSFQRSIFEFVFFFLFCLLPREFKRINWFGKVVMPLIWLLFLECLWGQHR